MLLDHRSVAALGRDLSEASHGVLSRRHLNVLGVGRHRVRTQVSAFRWEPNGRDAIRVLDAEWHPDLSPIIVATLNAGPLAWADGASALMLAGLKGWTPERVDVGMPRHASARSEGFAHHHRLVVAPPTWPHPVRRSHPAPAAIRAAAWASTDRQAAALLSMSVQQRLVHVSQLTATLGLLPKVKRRRFMQAVISDIAGGSESMGELDFVAECRKRGLPLPDRQVLRAGPRGRMHLDVVWEEARLCVEVDGAHHYVGDMPVADALRQNEITMGGLRVLRVPRLALRIDPDPFFKQIERALAVMLV